MTYCPVLAEQTPEIATGKKYRARTMGADKRGFFTKMLVPTGNKGSDPCAAKALFTLCTVHSAIARAQGTIFEERHCGADFFLQRLSGKFEVCGYEASILFFVHSLRPPADIKHVYLLVA